MLIGLFAGFSENVRPVIAMVGTVTIGIMLFQPTGVFIQMGTQTVQQISEYGKMLVPVMTAALAAQGAVTKSGAIYTATVFFDTLLSSAVSEILIPMLYIFLCLCVICKVFSQPLIVQMQKFLKWLMTWSLKIILYVFTGYISITGVISGTADQTAIKAAKLTISGMVPVVGGILSDASETVLIGAGVVKNAAGIYGFLAIVAVTIVPFLTIGINYLLLQATSAICAVFSPKSTVDLLSDFAGAMGLVLGMTGSVCLIQLISVVCFLKGMS